jgi:hypothetical protein
MTFNQRVLCSMIVLPNLGHGIPSRHITTGQVVR